MFYDILANNLPIWKVLIKGNKDSELTPSQVITINQKICCESVRNFINENQIPQMYKTYLKENKESNNHLSVGDFLEKFGISRKGVNQTITWRWLQEELGFEFKERKKSYFTDCRESKENVSYREDFVKKYFEAELNTYRWVHLREDVAKKWRKRKG